MSLSDSIKLIRQKTLLNQQEFADELKVGLTTVNRWEVGKSIPNLSAMKRTKRQRISWKDENTIQHSIL